MFETLIPTPSQFTENDLASIVADASFLWERLNLSRFKVDRNHSNQLEIERRCDRWPRAPARRLRHLYGPHGEYMLAVVPPILDWLQRE